MPVPLGPGTTTATGPSTGRLSMPVALRPFQILGRGLLTLTESSFSTVSALRMCCTSTDIVGYVSPLLFSVVNKFTRLVVTFYRRLPVRQPALGGLSSTCSTSMYRRPVIRAGRDDHHQHAGAQLRP